jgi:putative ABC transport system permease protein
MTGKHYILEQLQKIETNSIELEYSGGGAVGAERTVYNDSLTLEDENAVKAQLPGVMYSSPIMEMHARISFGQGIVKDTLVLGVSPQYQNIRNLLVPEGRFLDDEDESSHIKCAVVTPLFARTRFGSEDAASSRRVWMILAKRRSPIKPF